jgi:glutamate N-acetyltransferase / amino-acid N-acetyltransferase
LVNGEPEKVDEERASEILSLEDFEVLVDLGGGDEAEVAKYYTCDFSYVSCMQLFFGLRLLISGYRNT